MIVYYLETDDVLPESAEQQVFTLEVLRTYLALTQPLLIARPGAGLFFSTVENRGGHCGAP